MTKEASPTGMDLKANIFHLLLTQARQLTQFTGERVFRPRTDAHSDRYREKRYLLANANVMIKDNGDVFRIQPPEAANGGNP